MRWVPEPEQNEAIKVEAEEIAVPVGSTGWLRYRKDELDQEVRYL
jgi:hypothetical protein